jgi:formylmethanofuran dehydrogenase subunit E
MPARTDASTSDGVEAELAAITQVHGGAGPWVVAGYRMGEFALKRLGLPRGSFDLEVIHHSPREVQYSCVADGAATATGASLGKLNLSLVEATADRTHTLYRRRSTGQSVDLRVTRAFAARYLDVPRERLAQAGREVIALPDQDIFTVVDDAHP